MTFIFVSCFIFMSSPRKRRRVRKIALRSAAILARPQGDFAHAVGLSNASRLRTGAPAILTFDKASASNFAQATGVPADWGGDLGETQGLFGE